MPFLNSKQIHGTKSQIKTQETTHAHKENTVAIDTPPSAPVPVDKKTLLEIISIVRGWKDESRQLTFNFNGEIKKNDYMSNKDKGTLYERFIGEIYQKAGYKVENNGIEKGSHDGGIDLICRSDNYTVLVQCKNYKSPSLSVKDIYQFYGACRHYAVKNPREIVSGAFFISKPLSKYYDAFRAAVDLGITLYDGYAMPNDAN